MFNRKPCKNLENNICTITNFKTDGPHCHSCTSYEESQICKCGNVIEDGKELYHIYDIGNIEKPICESCLNDETI